MAIVFRCPTCHSALQVEDSLAGKSIRCGGCLGVLTVPSAEHQEPQHAFVPEPEPPLRSRHEEDFPGPQLRPRAEPEEDYGEPRSPRNLDENGEDRPRRRSRRPEKSSGSSRRLFWGVIIGCLLGIGLIGFAISKVGIFKASWRTHESVRGGFKVELPGNPRENLQGDRRLPALPGASTMAATHHLEHYVVMWHDLPDRDGRTDDEIIDEFVKKVADTNHAMEVGNGQPLSVGGYTAREIELTELDGDSILLRVIVAGRRVFVLMASGPTIEANDADVHRFFNSFEINNDRLPAARGNR